VGDARGGRFCLWCWYSAAVFCTITFRVAAALFDGCSFLDVREPNGHARFEFVAEERR
jgi:hypothetical protein